LTKWLKAFGGDAEEPPFASILAEYLLDSAGAVLRRACEALLGAGDRCRKWHGRDDGDNDNDEDDDDEGDDDGGRDDASDDKDDPVNGDDDADHEDNNNNDNDKRRRRRKVEAPPPSSFHARREEDRFSWSDTRVGKNGKSSTNTWPSPPSTIARRRRSTIPPERISIWVSCTRGGWACPKISHWRKGITTWRGETTRTRRPPSRCTQ
jgi:hypothetical protein